MRDGFSVGHGFFAREANYNAPHPLRVRVPSEHKDSEPLRRVALNLARLKGLEPLTHCLEGSCSIQLSYKRIKMERVMGIEPTQPAWKAGILPLNYTRIF